MTRDEIRLSCLENDGYDSPELNEKLYLHFKGYRRIENLDQYTGCKAIWLDSNGLERIEGLQSLVNLRCLYLGKNLISKIEGLDSLVHLTTLDLSNNRLTKVENLSCCISLQTVNLSRNALSTVDSIQHFKECLSIENIDVTNNNLEGDIVGSVLQHMPKLVAISINGNAVTQTPAFRKTTIAAMPKLCYLDRPVDEIERLGAEAFVSGGADAERAARESYREREKQNRKNEMESFRKWQQEHLETRKNKGELGRRCYISDFTPEEAAARENEARQAAEDERRVLELGVGRVGQRYWQMQGKSGNYDEDPLQAAVDSLLKEQEEKEKNSADKEVAATENIIPEEIVSEEVVGDELIPNEISEGSEVAVQSNKIGSKDLTVSREEEQEKNYVLEDDEQPVTELAEVEVVVESECQEVEVVVESECQEVESQEVRDQRVQESLAIYMRQQEQLRERRRRQEERGEAGNVLREQNIVEDTVTVSSTWEGPQSAVINRHVQTRVYWTEWMDIKLAELVRTCVFNFTQIAEAFNTYPSTEEFSRLPGAGLPRHEELRSVLRDLNEEECRLRWAELDARKWSVSGDDGGDQSRAVYKVCVQPDVLGKGHGAQPSFQALASQASGAMPSYLKVPSSFPSTTEFDDGAETDNDDCSLEKLD